MKKRGLNDIITAVLIILLAITVIAVIWVVAKRTILDSSSQINTESISTSLSIPAGSVKLEEEASKTISFLLKKSENEELTGIYIILTDESDGANKFTSDFRSSGLAKAKIVVAGTSTGITLVDGKV